MPKLEREKLEKWNMDEKFNTFVLSLLFAELLLIDIKLYELVHSLSVTVVSKCMHTA